MADNTCSIELSLGNVSISVSGPQGFVEAQFEELYENHGFDTIDVSNGDIDGSGVLPGNQDVTDADEADDESQPTIDKSLNEILSNSEIESMQEKALTVGWFLIRARGQDDITWDEVKKEAERSQVELGEQIPRDLRKCVEKGYLGPTGDERNGSDTYKITGTGEELLRKKRALA